MSECNRLTLDILQKGGLDLVGDIHPPLVEPQKTKSINRSNLDFCKISFFRRCKLLSDNELRSHFIFGIIFGTVFAVKKLFFCGTAFALVNFGTGFAVPPKRGDRSGPTPYTERPTILLFSDPTKQSPFRGIVL